MKQLLKKIIVFIITLEAKAVLWRFKPKIVVITGSVGKTSTKDAIATVLSKNFQIRKSQKSFNSEIGIPLVVLGCENAWLNPIKWLSNIFKGMKVFLFSKDYPEWLVLEAGVDRPKDMEKITSLIKPNIVVITTFAETPVHVEFFSGPEAVAKEKAKILKALKKEGTAILNGDDDAVYNLNKKTKANILTFGFTEVSDLLASNYRTTENGISFKADYDGSSVPVRINNIVGKHHVYSALAALAVGVSVGLNLVDMLESLVEYKSPAGRSKLIKGIKGSTVFDDSYNSSPLALRAALKAIKDLEAKRKIVALGDMLELGKYTIEAHRSVAEYIINAGVEFVFTVGPRSKFIAEALRENGFNKEKIFEFSNSAEAGVQVQEMIEEGDLILVKGSQGTRMEKIVEEIMAEPERAGELLVRQEKEWRSKK